MKSRSGQVALSLVMIISAQSGWAGPESDGVCFPLFFDAGAIPGGGVDCWWDAQDADIGPGGTYCTGDPDYAYRYCGAVPKAPNCPSLPHPIAIGTGAKWLNDSDYGIGDNLLSFSRHYNSSPVAARGNVLGASWRSNFQAEVVGFKDHEERRAVVRPDGRIYHFQLVSGAFVPDRDVNGRLFQVTDGWRYVDLDRMRIESFDAVGQLQRVTSLDGKYVALTYSAAETPKSLAPSAGLLITVSDQFERSLGLTYGAEGLQESLTGPDQSLYQYAVTEDGVQTVTYPDTVSKTYFYNESQFTSGLDIPTALTGVQDEAGHRFINYFYNSQANAWREQLLSRPGEAVGVQSIDFQSMVSARVDSAHDSPVGKSIVTGALNEARTYDFTRVLGIARLSTQSQPGGSGCFAKDQKFTYDSATGNMTSRLGFDGVKTCMGYDSARNLETVRVEGLPDAACPSDLVSYPIDDKLPADKPQRKVRTEWHSLWRLEARRAEPNLITTWVYNGETDPITKKVVDCVDGDPRLPDVKASPIAVLCKRYEQATEDKTGSLGFAAAATEQRSWSYSYDENGQLKDELAPRSTKKIVYTYWDQTSFPGDGKKGHWRGDLRSVKNRMGQVTDYLEYNKRGQPTKIRFPNKSIEFREYHARGWLSKVTLTPAGSNVGEVTRYDYWDNGLIKQVTEPDGSWTSYTWDYARRLTDVKDSALNSVHYTLDAAGNRTGEEYRGSKSELSKTIGRTFDVLGRMSSETVAP
jgi:YD repeat-containing protein